MRSIAARRARSGSRAVTRSIRARTSPWPRLAAHPDVAEERTLERVTVLAGPDAAVGAALAEHVGDLLRRKVGPGRSDPRPVRALDDRGRRHEPADGLARR